MAYFGRRWRPGSPCSGEAFQAPCLRCGTGAETIVVEVRCQRRGRSFNMDREETWIGNDREGDHAYVDEKRGR